MTKGRKVVLVGLPGAFTPPRSSQQVPGYLAKEAELKAKGVSDVITYCVNDGAVMQAWAADQQVGNSIIEMFGDPGSVLTEALGLVLDHPGPMSVLGNPRCKRFSMFIDNGVCTVQCCIDAFVAWGEHCACHSFLLSNREGPVPRGEEDLVSKQLRNQRFSRWCSSSTAKCPYSDCSHRGLHGSELTAGDGQEFLDELCTHSAKDLLADVRDIHTTKDLSSVILDWHGARAWIKLEFWITLLESYNVAEAEDNPAGDANRIFPIPP